MSEEGRTKSSDTDFVKENIGSICFKGKQYLLGLAKEIMESYPTTIGKPMIENALKQNGTIKVEVKYTSSEEIIKPYLLSNGTIVINQ